MIVKYLYKFIIRITITVYPLSTFNLGVTLLQMNFLPQGDQTQTLVDFILHLEICFKTNESHI